MRSWTERSLRFFLVTEFVHVEDLTLLAHMTMLPGALRSFTRSLPCDVYKLQEVTRPVNNRLERHWGRARREI